MGKLFVQSCLQRHTRLTPLPPGLGGGMGVFLAGPIVDELSQCAKAGDEVRFQ